MAGHEPFQRLTGFDKTVEKGFSMLRP